MSAKKIGLVCFKTPVALSSTGSDEWDAAQPQGFTVEDQGSALVFRQIEARPEERGKFQGMVRQVRVPMENVAKIVEYVDATDKRSGAKTDKAGV